MVERETVTRLCARCSKPSVQSWCTNCKNESERKRWSQLTSDKRAERHYLKKYRLTYTDVLEKLQAQDYKCSCCYETISLSDPNKAVVDHCHSTKKVRDLLCNHCNKVLGLVKENVETLQNMITYLRKYSDDTSHNP